MFGKRAFCLAAMALMVVLAALPGHAQNSVGEGAWINLFDGESLYGWTNFGDVEWAIADGALKAEKGNSGFLATTSQFTDFELTAKVRVTSAGSAALAVRSGLEGFAAESGAGVIQLPAGKEDAFVDITVKAVGDKVEATVNGQNTPLTVGRACGYITLQYQKYHRDKKTPVVEFKDIKLRPLGLSSLFNGKSLDGWNIIPDHKSQFSVIDGALNIKDGNGQIETAGTFKNFMLQLDIFSNGDHLNSGVFFRTPVGVFWKGYESQVRNQWEGDNRNDPVDYGTGGVYGLCPARKVVSTDREWFSKTVVCNGNHIAVWINGYQVSDFYDTRPIDEHQDGKNGYVPDAGTINLQGHDPTTDLSFKNINIQSYPEK